MGYKQKERIMGSKTNNVTFFYHRHSVKSNQLNSLTISTENWWVVNLQWTDGNPWISLGNASGFSVIWLLQLAGFIPPSNYRSIAITGCFYTPTANIAGQKLTMLVVEGGIGNNYNPHHISPSANSEPGKWALNNSHKNMVCHCVS